MSRNPRANELDQVFALGWSETRVAAHYGVSVRQVGRWREEGAIPVRAPAPPMEIHYTTALIISDTQFPYVDRALWETTCQIARDVKPDQLIWNGDNLDFPQFSSFSHNPYLLRSAKEDVEAFHDVLRLPLLREMGDNVVELWNDGNHEQRYERYAANVAAALEDSVVDLKQFLELGEEVIHTPYGKGIGTWLTPSLLVSHGWRANAHSAYTAKANLDDLGGVTSVITGHTHRVGQYVKATPNGVVRSYEMGHMADIDDLPKSVPGFQNWQQVAGVLVRVPRRVGGDFKVDILEVGNDDTVEARGRFYKVDR